MPHCSRYPAPTKHTYPSWVMSLLTASVGDHSLTAGLLPLRIQLQSVAAAFPTEDSRIAQPEASAGA